MKDAIIEILNKYVEDLKSGYDGDYTIVPAVAAESFEDIADDIIQEFDSLYYNENN